MSYERRRIHVILGVSTLEPKNLVARAGISTRLAHS
jgi:hypothetical protein